MEAHIKKYKQKVSAEKSPKYLKNLKVPVVYYLCRNKKLEHPHFMEVPLSSSNGLYLKDVIDKLNALRGRGMASLYSWSCKRSYKKGFVWHDLCEDDLILPGCGTEYVLKGSELFDESNSDCFSPVSNIEVQSLKQSPEPVSCRSHDETFSSSSLNVSSDVSLRKHIGSSNVSPKSSAVKSASTQTEENGNRLNIPKTCTRAVSTDEVSSEPECKDCDAPTSIYSPSTLESLIRADVSKMKSCRILEDDRIRMPTNTKAKGMNPLMQVISCGSISVKNHSFGLIPSYKAKLSDLNFPSPLFSTSIMLRGFDYLGENPKVLGLRLEDKGDVHNVLKHSSSYSAHR